MYWCAGLLFVFAAVALYLVVDPFGNDPFGEVAWKKRKAKQARMIEEEVGA